MFARDLEGVGHQRRCEDLDGAGHQRRCGCAQLCRRLIVRDQRKSYRYSGFGMPNLSLPCRHWSTPLRLIHLLLLLKLLLLPHLVRHLVVGGKAPVLMPQRVKLRTRQLTPQSGPEPKPPLSVNIKHKPVEQKTTLRLLAPQQYRSAFLSKGSNTPASVISVRAQILDCQVSALTGGRWKNLSLKNTQERQMYCKTPHAECLCISLRKPLLRVAGKRCSPLLLTGLLRRKPLLGSTRAVLVPMRPTSGFTCPALRPSTDLWFSDKPDLLS